jgi:hypothetical protein
MNHLKEYRELHGAAAKSTEFRYKVSPKVSPRKYRNPTDTQRTVNPLIEIDGHFRSATRRIYDPPVAENVSLESFSYLPNYTLSIAFGRRASSVPADAYASAG